MKIIHLAAEFAPIAKVGGLGEVVLGLSRSLILRGAQVEVIVPKYDSIDVRKISGLKMEVADFKCVESGVAHANAMWSGVCEQCPIHLLEARHPAGYFHRGKIYGCEDDTARFLYFSRACLEYLKARNEPVDVLHLHDWHVAAAAVLAREVFRIPIKAILLTIHNVEYQGHCATWDLDRIGLKGVDYLVKERLQDDDPKRPQTINLLKGGVVYSDWVNTVSPSYAKEILTSEMGFRLDTTLRKYREKISGILNGIDQVLWNPGSDKALPKSYDADSSLQKIMDAKMAAREEIRKRFGLEKNGSPWVGSIGRLVPQKGPELIEAGLHACVRLGGTFVLLGSSAAPKIQAHFAELRKEYLPNKRVLLHFEYDEELSHLLYAALDFLLVPSHYEPCGLTQLIAMRYGTIPIVRATGGLKDTVFDCDDPFVPMKQKNGFVFHLIDREALETTLERAVGLFRKDAPGFQAMVRRAMQQDFSWEKPGQEYLRLYLRCAR